MIEAIQATSTPSRALILGLADADGRLEAEPLYAVAEAAGLTNTTIRLALRRLVEADLVESEGRGRKATLQLTPAGLAERLPDLIWVAAAHRADAGLDSWDGYWHLVSFEIPESDRPARDALRNRIVELLGAPLGGALYVSPHPWEPWIDAVANANAVTDRVTTITATQLQHRGSADLAAVAQSLWPVEDLAADYEAFVDRWTQLPSMIDRDTAIRLAFEASGEIELLLRRDPLLPTQMLPAGFAGPAARALYLDTMGALATEPLVAEANIYTAYRTAIDRAVGQTADEFWTEAYANTGAIHP
jgi:phenylacetic acid degradation operon negative regulatory protein